MNLQCHRFWLPLERPFTIARGTMTHQASLVVELSQDNERGWGEVTANDYYGHTISSIESSIERVRDFIESAELGSPESFYGQLLARLPNDPFARCALDLAAQDLYGRLHHRRCYELWGLSAEGLCPSSYTIAIDPPDVMVEKLRAAPGWPVYKIKMGFDGDVDVLELLRRETDAPFRIDANCGWTADETIEKSERLKDLGVEFIEQPLPAEATSQENRRVYEQSHLPVIADESCREESDVDRCAEFFHGINVKLCKCGGLTPALRMLRRAKELNLKTMVGCMIESSIGISANAQLLPLLDYADLDGALLLRNEPATGVTIDRGTVQFTDLPGCGATLKSSIDPELIWSEELIRD